jgi:hypothetical protein
MGSWRIRYVTRIYHVFDKREYDAIKSTTVDEELVTDLQCTINQCLLETEPYERVRLQISERYQVDEEG